MKKKKKKSFKRYIFIAIDDEKLEAFRRWTQEISEAHKCCLYDKTWIKHKSESLW